MGRRRTSRREVWLGLASLVMLAAGCGRRREKEEPGAVPPRKNGTGTSLPRNRLSRETALALEQAEKDQHWLSAKESVYTSVDELLLQHQSELIKGLQYDKIIRGNPKRRQIAITFDDGPHPQYTPQILSILDHYQVKATFFVVGEMAEKYPDLILAEMKAGHSIGNHTYHHVSLPKIPEEYVATEIQACGEVIEAITGKKPQLFRPPGGQYNQKIAEVTEALGYTLVLWTDDPKDYTSPGKDVIEQRLLAKISPGGIVLIHDGVQETIDLLPQLLEQLKKEGYELVTVDRMVEESRGAILSSASLFPE